MDECFWIQEEDYAIWVCVWDGQGGFDGGFPLLVKKEEEEEEEEEEDEEDER